jgi:uncharacterized membrane protein
MSTGVCIWLIGLYVVRNQPKNRNQIYGYRTPQSMKSQEAWDYAQIHGTRRMIGGAKLLCLLAILAILFPMEEVKATLIGVAIILLALFIPLIQTEKELKEKFK